MARILHGLALILCCTLLGAADIQGILAGKWSMNGMVSLDQDGSDENPFGDSMPKMDATFAGDAIELSMGNNVAMKITWTVLAEKPEGIDIEMTGGLFGGGDKRKKGQLVVLEDGIVLVDASMRGMGMRMGMKFTRADGKPVGLAPSVRPKPPAVDPNSPEIAKQFTSEVQELTISRTIRFEDGDLTAPKVQSSSQLQIILSWPKRLAVLRQHKAAELAEAVTDAGEDLIPPKGKDRHRFFQGGHVYDNRMHLSLPIAAPAKPAKSIRLLRATVNVVCERSASKPVVFTGIKSWVGKEQVLPDGKTVHIVSVEGSELKYRIAGQQNEVIKSVVIKDAAGRILPSHGSGWNGSDGETICTVQARRPIPVDAVVEFTGFGDTAIVAVPIVLKDIPLGDEVPGAAGGGAALF